MEGVGRGTLGIRGHGTVRGHCRHAVDVVTTVPDAWPGYLAGTSNLSPMKQIICLASAFALAGCGSTDPENLLFISGVVVAAADGGGYSQGQPIDGAQITLRYQPPLRPSSEIFDTDVADGSGAWAVQTRPPRGQSVVDCSTLTVSAIKVGFSSSTVRMSTLCDTGPGDVSGVEIELTPN